MSRFPKITETFILYEMVAMEKQGVNVDLYPLLKERTNVMHPEAIPFVKRANFQPFVSWEILRAHLYYLRRKPRIYFRTLWTLLTANWGSRRYFFGALGIFPKSVYFAKKMAEREIKHVHAHFASHPAAAAFIIKRLTGIPYSFTAHGSDLHRDRHMLREKVAEAEFVVPISLYNKNVILKECRNQFNEKLVVIHCGVDPSTFHPKNRRTLDSKSGLSFFCIGTLHEVKGQTHLVEACRHLRELDLSIDCHFIGDGPDRSALLAQVAAAGLEECIHFHGRKTHQEIAGLLQKADVAVAPSVPTKNGRREGIPVVLMEAMASGLPVVASRLSGIPELVKHEHNGLLVPPGDVQSLTNALKRLYDDSTLRSRLGNAGRQTILSDFNLFKNAKTLQECFNK